MELLGRMGCLLCKRKQDWEPAWCFRLFTGMVITIAIATAEARREEGREWSISSFRPRLASPCLVRWRTGTGNVPSRIKMLGMVLA